MLSRQFKSRLQKRILLESAALVLEAEESDELDTEYKEKFKQDFQNELEFLSSKEEVLEEGSMIEGSDIVEKNPVDIHPLIKKLFREVAKRTHPDMFGEKYLEEFKRANIAQEENDWVALLILTNDLGIDLPTFSEDIKELVGEDMSKRRQFLEGRKDGLAWVWASCEDPSEDRRVAARRVMQINEEEFQLFLKGRS